MHHKNIFELFNSNVTKKKETTKKFPLTLFEQNSIRAKKVKNFKSYSIFRKCSHFALGMAQNIVSHQKLLRTTIAVVFL